MGGLISVPASFVASCLGSASCQLLFACCPSFDGPIGTRMIYAFFLMLIAILQSISMIPSLTSVLIRIPRMCPANLTAEKCAPMVGYLVSYKICFGYLLFAMLMIMLSARIGSKQSVRAKFHNYAHGLKFLLLCLLIVAAFAIPTTNPFLVVIRMSGFAGGLVFIIIQLICVVDFAHLLNESWLERLETGGSRWWLVAQLSVSLGSLIGSVAIYVLTLIYYGHTAIHIGLVSFNIILTLTSSIISVLPIIRQFQPTSGLLQSSLVSLYVSYLSWTAISSDPNSILRLTSKLSTNFLLACSLIIFILSVLYSVFSTTLTRNVTGSSEENGAAKADDDVPEYSYESLHILLLLASLYVTMTLTSWLKPTSDIHAFVKNYGAFWVKASSCWFCFAIYIWTCLAPWLLQDRDFR